MPAIDRNTASAPSGGSESAPDPTRTDTTPESLERIIEACACTGLRKATRAVTQAYDECLEPSGLRTTQLVTLLIIGREGPASITHLARALVMDSSTMTRTLKPLQQQGLIQRVGSAGQRRKMIALTDHGLAAIKRALPYWQRAQGAILGRFSASEQSALADLLEKAVQVSRAR